MTPPRSPLPTAAQPAQRGAGRSNVNPLLAVATVVLFITTVLFGLMALAPSSAPIKTRSVQRAAEGNTEEQIKDTASRFTENLLTYKYQTVDTDFSRTLRDTTQEFSTRPLDAFDGKNVAQVKSSITSAKGTSSIDVKGVAITSRDADTATVLVVGTRTFDSNQRDNPARVVQVVELTLLNTSEGWKVDNAAKPASAT